MQRYILIISTIWLFISQVNAQQTDSIKISADDFQRLMQRVERLEQQQRQSQQMGIDARTGATQRVDGKTGATAPTQASQSQKKTLAKDTTGSRVPRWIHNRLTIGGYGEVSAKYCYYSNNYLRYGMNAQKYKNDRYGEVDLPHVVIFLGYDFGKGWSMGTEIEFEHGGTESAIEIEEEEGGEYESEVERGGEVALEQFWFQKRFNDYAVIRAGMQVVPVGGLNANHESTQFFGVYRPEGEYTILPSTWHEVALTFMGKTPFGLHYQAMLLPGLDSDRFNRKNWVKSGAGSPYEFKIANVWAGALRLDYTGVKGLRLSVSGYAGESFRNTLSKSSGELENSDTYKKVKGIVSIGSFDFAYDDHNWIARGNVTYGHLSDAALISKYNIGMRKGSVSSKQWVASDALAVGAEVGYDFFHFNDRLQEKNMRFYLFCRYDYYDSMFRYDGKKDYTYAWCGRHKATVGINYFPIKQIAVKAEFAYAVLNPGIKQDGSKGKIFNDEPYIAVGIAYSGMFRL